MASYNTESLLEAHGIASHGHEENLEAIDLLTWSVGASELERSTQIFSYTQMTIHPGAAYKPACYCLRVITEGWQQ